MQRRQEALPIKDQCFDPTKHHQSVPLLMLKCWDQLYSWHGNVWRANVWALLCASHCRRVSSTMQWLLGKRLAEGGQYEGESGGCTQINPDTFDRLDSKGRGWRRSRPTGRGEG